MILLSFLSFGLIYNYTSSKPIISLNSKKFMLFLRVTLIEAAVSLIRWEKEPLKLNLLRAASFIITSNNLSFSLTL